MTNFLRNYFDSRRFSARPNRDKRCVRLHTERLEPRVYLAGSGLSGQYFHNDNFTGLADTRTEAVSHNWKTDSPGSGLDADSFSVRWTGQVKPQYSERYTFSVLNDEAVRVWVDGQLIVDDWTSHSTRYSAGSIDLRADQSYDIRIDYREGAGEARVELNWFSATQAFQLVPAARLYASPAGLLGVYSDAEGGSLTRVDSALQFDWGNLPPAEGIAADEFRVTWSGRLRPDFSEPYTFSTTSDDSLRLWIGNELVIDNWTNPTQPEKLGTKWLEAGKWYDIRLEYYERTGSAEISLRWSSDQQTGMGTFQVIPSENVRAMLPTPQQFRNPLGSGADPFVAQWDDAYYLVRSSGNSVRIDRAESLERIHASTPQSDTVTAWTAPPGTNYSHQVWAPELHRLSGRWYIYVAASDGNNATHRMHVLERDAEDPFGPYVYKGQITPPTDRWAIDGTVLEWQGVNYFVWSGWSGFSDGQQNLYIAEMRAPWILHGDRVLLSSPQYAWERHGLSINEGPQILIHDGQLHIVYSASGYWTPQYALGRLTYQGSGSLLDRASWTKAPLPVFQRHDQVVGTGHASFTKSPDGNEHWMVYHAHANANVFNEDRVARIQPFTFHPDGTPDFGQPVPSTKLLSVPSAGPDPERPFLKGDFNADGKVDAADATVWRATFGANVFPGTGADGNGNGIIDAADYVIWRRHLGQAAANTVLGNQASVATLFDNFDSAPVGADDTEQVAGAGSVESAAIVRFPSSHLVRSTQSVSRRTVTMHAISTERKLEATSTALLLTLSEYDQVDLSGAESWRFGGDRSRDLGELGADAAFAEFGSYFNRDWNWRLE